MQISQMLYGMTPNRKIDAGGPGSGRHADFTKVATAHGFTPHPVAAWNKNNPASGFGHPAGHSLSVNKDGSGAKLYTQHPTNPNRFSSTGKSFDSPSKLDNHLTKMSVVGASSILAHLKEGSSAKTIGKNIAIERNAGKAEDQAIAIAYSKAGKSRDVKAGGPGSGRHATGTKLAEPGLHKLLLKHGFKPAGTELDSKHLGMFRNKNRALYRNDKGHEVTADPKGYGWNHRTGPDGQGYTNGTDAKDFADFRKLGANEYDRVKGSE